MTYENCYEILKYLGYSYEYIQDTTDGTLWYIIQQPSSKQYLKIPNIGNNLGMVVAALLFAHKKYFIINDNKVEIKDNHENITNDK